MTGTANAMTMQALHPQRVRHFVFKTEGWNGDAGGCLSKPLNLRRRSACQRSWGWRSTWMAPTLPPGAREATRTVCAVGTEGLGGGFVKALGVCAPAAMSAPVLRPITSWAGGTGGKWLAAAGCRGGGEALTRETPGPRAHKHDNLDTASGWAPF